MNVFIISYVENIKHVYLHTVYIYFNHIKRLKGNKTANNY